MSVRLQVMEASFQKRRACTQLHGTEATVWPMMDEAITRGYDVRIGLEDTLVMPDGRIARDNAELVTEAVRRVLTS